MLSKKANFLLSGTVLIFLVALIGFNLGLDSKINGLSVKTIGKSQMDLIDTYYDGEFAMLAMERCIKLSSYNTLNNNEFSTEFEKEFLLKFDEGFSKCIKNYPNANLNGKYKSNFNEDSLIITPDNNLIFDRSVRSEEEDKKIAEGEASASIPAENIDNFLKEQVSPLEGLGNCFVEAEKSSGIPAKVIMAVTALESNWGNSELAGEKCTQDDSASGPSYNLFSIKGSDGSAGSCKWNTIECLSESQKKNAVCSGFCSNGKSKCTVLANFRAYNNKCDSVNDFIELIQTSRYWDGTGSGDPEELPNCKPVKDVLYNPEEIVKRIHYCGYATDPEWSNKVIRIINSLDDSFKVTGAAIFEKAVIKDAPVNIRYEIKPSVQVKMDFIPAVGKLRKNADCGEFNGFTIKNGDGSVVLESKESYLINGELKKLSFTVKGFKCNELFSPAK